MNQFVTEGKVIAQPTRQEIGQGTKTEVLLEVDDGYTDREGNVVERMMTVPVETWRDTLPPGVSKGAVVRVKGSVKARSWTKPETGEIRHFTSLNLAEVKVIKAAPEGSAAPAEPEDNLPF